MQHKFAFYGSAYSGVLKYRCKYIFLRNTCLRIVCVCLPNSFLIVNSRNFLYVVSYEIFIYGFLLGFILVGLDMDKLSFLRNRPWISPWIKSISKELDIIIHVIASQLSRYCDVIRNRLWRHHQNEDRASETRGRCVKIVVLSSFMEYLCRLRNKIIYVLSWQTVSALTRVLFSSLFINTKITLSWALKQFITGVHT